jgi:hypothetical protein
LSLHNLAIVKFRFLRAGFCSNRYGQVVNAEAMPTTKKLMRINFISLIYNEL